MARIIPLLDAKAPFHLEPADVANEIELNALRHIRDGKPGLTARLIPSLELEAVARLKPLAITSLDTRPPDSISLQQWLAGWQHVAEGYALRDDVSPESVGWAAAQVILRARDLREAIESGDAEKSGALAMLIGAWLFVGGIGIKYAEAAPIAERHVAAQRKKAKKPRATVQTDDGGTRKRDLIAQAMQAAGGADATTPEVWGHLATVLRDAGLDVTETGAKAERRLSVQHSSKELAFTFKGVQTMLTKLRKAPVARGRPRKKPA